MFDGGKIAEGLVSIHMPPCEQAGKHNNSSSSVRGSVGMSFGHGATAASKIRVC